jgi:5-methylcytosine-specific restriction endonuclease McrA
MIYRNVAPTKRTNDLKLKQELDGLLRAFVLERDGHTCVRCGSTNKLQAAHILSKGTHPRLRFEPLNLLSLCVACHIFGWHRNPVEFAEWLETKYPGRHERLLIADRCSPRVDVKCLLSVWRRLRRSL